MLFFFKGGENKTHDYVEELMLGEEEGKHTNTSFLREEQQNARICRRAYFKGRRRKTHEYAKVLLREEQQEARICQRHF